MGCDTQVPRGTRLWQWQVFTSRHKGTLPASAPSEATATVGGAGKGRALSLGPGGPGPFVLPLRRGPEPLPPPDHAQDPCAGAAGSGHRRGPEPGQWLHR